MRKLALLIIFATGLMTTAANATEVLLHAAGSLNEAFTEAAQSFLRPRPESR